MEQLAITLSKNSRGTAATFQVLDWAWVTLYSHTTPLGAPQLSKARYLGKLPRQAGRQVASPLRLLTLAGRPAVRQSAPTKRSALAPPPASANTGARYPSRVAVW
jgi:hypothetical protein